MREFTNASRRTVLKTIGAAGALLATGGVASAQQIQAQRFTCESTMTVEYQNPSSGETIETREYTDTNVEVIITNPLARGAQGETNPFHLEVLPGASLLPDNPNVEGSLSIYSAYDFGNTLEQFWTIQLDASNQFSGSIDQQQTDQDPVLLNYLQAWRPGQEIVRPLPLTENTSLEGTLEGSDLTLTVTGNAVDPDGTPVAPFEAEITGSNP